MRSWCRRVVLDRLLRVSAGAVLVLVAGMVGGCGGSDRPDGVVPDEPPSRSAGPDFSGADLWLSFDDEAVGYDGSQEFADALGGPFAGRVVTANGGAVEWVSGAEGRGRAVEFPSRCTRPSGCPRAMVEVPPSRALDPEDRAFSYGASVWLAPDQTAIGSNIVQKGRFGSEGGQWKLQVDGEDGRPSCVVRSGEEVWTVKSGLTVADSSWHHVVCRRDGRGITISVDGAEHSEKGGSGTVSNSFPIRVGSPGVGDEDDQFHGRVDDVFVAIDGG